MTTFTQSEIQTPTADQKLKPATDKGYTLGVQGAHNLAFGGLEYKDARPKFTDPLQERKHVLEHMAGTFRVFGRMGYSEGPAGHISVRDPVDRETFWINPLGMHFSQICVSDLVHIDSEGNVLKDGNQSAINGAGFRIHAQLHKSRPDVNAACHAHTVYGKAWAAFGKELDMINQDACIFYKSHAVYQDFGGVVLEQEEGRRLAEALGHRKALLLVNHGLLTVGETVDEAAYLFCLMERTCQVQLQVEMASVAGLKRRIIDDEAAYYTYFNTSDPESLYAAFQPDYKLEVKLTNGEFLR
ncbi:uncharacterized protein LALA0_S02e08328g [Lachancea lanzarotensis]|uniref:LALA0S02e08328g1_1 n=1 Tax=Lachancea lanzarotensis TaxID=1245769 RepID=A0A0C7MZV9_9SACH|nr:uncharacterized protein LALA0_S02e08328g [Lachancea lanzarotensis]CEP61172.1 LALA0S02e08328g1_1 [Lachancea lanzarotensis]